MIEFRMQQIKVDQFAMLSDTFDKNNIDIQTNSGVAVDTEHQMVRLQMKYDYLSDNQLVLTLAISCFFAVDPSSWKSMLNKDGLTLPHGFLSHLALHTVGTARGILFSKTEGTPLQQLILPPLNVEKMFQEDLIIK